MLFKKAAQIYRTKGLHKESAMCFASAASCWAAKAGEKPFFQSAANYREAALEAEADGDWEYASLLYRYAAISFERDMEFSDFSDCFYRSKECHRTFLALRLFRRAKLTGAGFGHQPKGIRGFLREVFLWLSLTLSSTVWGYGEKPGRTLLSGLFLILVSAASFTQLSFLENGMVSRPDFWQAFYFSVVTFTTVGYGDIAPIGLARGIVVLELFCGLFIVPLFIVGLSRKYLRI
ncbi:MAG: ion channel [Candidatus Omnitrophota bacterium]